MTDRVTPPHPIPHCAWVVPAGGNFLQWKAVTQARLLS
jgi:hypothetical protein